MIRRSLSPMHEMLSGIVCAKDARRLNEIVNHASVLPWVKGSLDGPLDLSVPVADRRNVTLLGEHGAVLFHWHQPGLYEAHTQVLPEGRGGWTLSFVRAALHWLFTRTEATEILTKCPRGNVAAKALARSIHGAFDFTNHHGWFRDGILIPTDIYSLKVQDWVRQAPGLVERGRWFHERLEEEFALHAIQEPPHPDDEAHDRYVGAACEMLLGGQPEKGVAFYNRWAVMAGYEQVKIVMNDPLTVDIKTAVIRVSERDFSLLASEEMSCR